MRFSRYNTSGQKIEEDEIQERRRHELTSEMSAKEEKTRMTGNLT